MAFKFYTSVAKESKIKVRKFWRLIPTFVEVTGEKGKTSRETSGIWLKLGILKKFAILARKNLCWGLFLKNCRPATLLKRDSNTNVFL